jgi:hypothetical protein
MSTLTHFQNKQTFSTNQRQLAEAIRAACIQAALEGYQDASMSGLCHEGAWEMAIDAMRALDIEAIIKEEFVTRRQ